MIVWLASYPKSGNTFVRSMLASYFFSKDGSYDFSLIKNIKQFPHGGLFQKLGIDINNQSEVIKNYIRVQDIINKSRSIQFFKTHSFFFEQFTNLNNTLGVIYIVRDPRNVIISFSSFMNMSIEETLKFMTKQDKKIVILDIPLFLENKLNKKNDILVFASSNIKNAVEKILVNKNNFHKFVKKNQL